MFERQQVLLQYSSYTVHYVTVIVFVTLHYVLVILYFVDTNDEVLNENDDESESDSCIKVPPPPPPTDTGMKKSDSNCTSSTDTNKGTLLPITIVLGCLATTV